MRDLSVLIKPCSSSCNMKCDYCFYNDLAQKRSISNYGIMKYDVLEHIVKSALKSAERSCVFAFQGGEPTLAGIEFYEKCLELQKKYGGDKHINNIIQTNGYALDENWCSFFAENQFLVGVSLDGNKSIHDKYRKTLNGLSTFERVISNIKLLQGQNVQFNILTVITKDLASCGGKIYSYYKKNRFNYLQFIPCLDPVGDESLREYSLSPLLYGKFLIDVFDLWYDDILKGEQPYIRNFENYINILLGIRPYACDQKGVCNCQYVIEANGDVFPCDFYAFDEYNIGNIKNNTFDEIKRNMLSIGFRKRNSEQSDKCCKCEFYYLCRGGCKRHYINVNNEIQNKYCESYQIFFNYALNKLKRLAALIKLSMGENTAFGKTNTGGIV